MQKKRLDTRRLVLLAMLSAILVIMAFTPLGYLNVGVLAITLNMIPVAIGAVALGPGGGAFLGLVFGITSCLQCVGIGGVSKMGMLLFEISPVLTIIQRLIPRVLAGFLTGIIYKKLHKLHSGSAPYLAGFCAALLNTVLFMAALILIFSRTDYLQGLIAGKNVFLFAVTFVGINAVVEMFATTVAAGAVSKTLEKLKMIGGK